MNPEISSSEELVERSYAVTHTFFVPQIISKGDPVPTVTCLPQAQEPTMLDKLSTSHFSAALSKHFLGVWKYENKNIYYKDTSKTSSRHYLPIDKEQVKQLTNSVAFMNGT